MKSTMQRITFASVLALTAALLAACGGGGGGGPIPSTPIPTFTPSPSPSPTNTPTPKYALSGVVTSCDSTFTGAGSIPGAGSACTPNAAISGASAVLGTLPCANTSTGFATCSVPGAPTASTTTDASGNFSFANLAAGTYMLTISNGSGYATLHAKVTISANASVSYHLTQLSSTEQSWLAQFNTDRHADNAAASSALGIDEYAQETARALASYLASSSCDTTCKTSSSSGVAYANQYGTNGGIYSDYLEWNGPNFTWQNAESGMMTNPNEAPPTQLLSANVVWVGLAEYKISGASTIESVWSVPQ